MAVGNAIRLEEPVGGLHGRGRAGLLRDAATAVARHLRREFHDPFRPPPVPQFGRTELRSRPRLALGECKHAIHGTIPKSPSATQKHPCFPERKASSPSLA